MEKTTRRGMATQQLVFLAVLIAMQLVVGRFSFGTNYLKISATFLISSLIGYWYGPLYTGIALGVADMIGATLLPNGTFNIGFTFVAIFSGFIYGWLLDHRKMQKLSRLRIVAVALIMNLGSHLILNTLLIHFMYGAKFWPLFLTRLPKELLMIPIYYIGILFLLKTVDRLKLNSRLGL